MEYSARINVGSHQLFFQTLGNGEPTVVFESGGGCGSDSLMNLAQQVQSFARALVYDRAGLGQSDAAPLPRTIQDSVSDLHTLLHTAWIPGPYLLVGHSLGGLIVRLYATQHPLEVAGLVLLDVPHPEQSLLDLQLLPDPSPGESPALTAFRDALKAEWNDPLSNEEGFDRAASAPQVLAGGYLGDLPLVVITAGLDEWEPEFPTEIAHALSRSWMQKQQELAKLSNNSRQIIATESTHAIQDCQPDLVIDVIAKLVEELRN